MIWSILSSFCRSSLSSAELSARYPSGQQPDIFQSATFEIEDGSVRGGIQSAQRLRPVYIGMQRDQFSSACRQPAPLKQPQQQQTGTVHRHASRHGLQNKRPDARRDVARNGAILVCLFCLIFSCSNVYVYTSICICNDCIFFQGYLCY